MTEETIAAARAMGARLVVNRVKAFNGFSDDDFLTGSGYLVDAEEVLYQSGRHEIKRLGPLN